MLPTSSPKANVELPEVNVPKSWPICVPGAAPESSPAWAKIGPVRPLALEMRRSAPALQVSSGDAVIVKVSPAVSVVVAPAVPMASA